MAISLLLSSDVVLFTALILELWSTVTYFNRFFPVDLLNNRRKSYRRTTVPHSVKDMVRVLPIRNREKKYKKKFSIKII